MADAITRAERAALIERTLAFLDADEYNRLRHANACALLRALVASEAEVERLKAALDERELFINPHLMEQAADEIDCGGSCENIWWEGDTNASGCRKSERAEYCPNDVAETLRAVAKVARAALTGEKK